MPAHRPVKIAILTNDLGGGTGNHLLSMLKHWDKTQWHAVIFSSAPARDRVVPDVPVEYLPPSRAFRFYPAAQIRSLSLLHRAMRDFRPDVVHAFFFWPIIYGRLLKRAGVLKTLVENREDQGFDWGRHEYVLLRNTRNIPDRIICVSEAVRQVVLDREGIRASRVHVVNNGVDPRQEPSGKQSETKRELGLEEGNLVVGMVANYNRPVKGVARFLDAIPAIVAAVPSARFLFVGGGNEEQSLRDKAKYLAIEPYLVFAGYRKDIHRYYEIMDISVLTSLSEGLSLTLLESMGYGIPIVATRVGGNPEVVVEGETGYLVPVGDTSALADRIVRLLKIPELRRRMGEEGRSRGERKFRMGNVADRYLEIYNELLMDRFHRVPEVPV
jgi:glycosyltransferase involved in cell wall biosynthesis